MEERRETKHATILNETGPMSCAHIALAFHTQLHHLFHIVFVQIIGGLKHIADALIYSTQLNFSDHPKSIELQTKKCFHFKLVFINYAVTHINGLPSTNSICSVFPTFHIFCSLRAEFNEQRNNDRPQFMRKPKVSANKAHSKRICLHNKKVKHLFSHANVNSPAEYTASLTY